jgi:hypothetical protein
VELFNNGLGGRRVREGGNKFVQLLPHALYVNGYTASVVPNETLKEKAGG